MVFSFIGIRDAFDRRREYQLGDSIKYFLDNLEKTNHVDYLPDQSDILHARKATKGIVESKIEIEGELTVSGAWPIEAENHVMD